MKLASIIPPAKLYALTPLEKGLWAKNIRECPDGKRGATFEVWDADKKLGFVTSRLMGRHNVLNALGALAAGQALGVDFSVMASALAKYGGAGRRFDVKYEDKEYLVVDDYAHHPTEIAKTLEAARRLGKNRIVAIFQPHRFSRTELLMESFGKSFADADKLILTDIYAASEEPRPGVTGKKMVEVVRRSGHLDVLFADRESLADVARGQIRPGDLVLVMGAGDISQVATQLSEYLKLNGCLTNIFSHLHGKISINESLSKHTTLKVGGPAEFWVEPADEEDLRQALRTALSHGLRVTIFGAGSNVLPPDEGLRGLVIHLGAPYFRQIRVEGDLLIARAGVPNTLFIQRAMDEGFGGFEFLLGIPGNIGGAIAMNAGSHGQSIAPFVRCVRTVDDSGKPRERESSQIPFGYRNCGLKKETFTEVSFLFPKASRAQTQKKLDEYREHRVKTQDLQHPSAGCMFKNPEIPGCSSGKLIDEAGLKGLTVGKAQVSPVHANFLVNLGGATSRDIRQLIERVRETVREKTGIELETEVKVLE
jgi:UDP-N-acetylenolpyruvoylglucosamine reductase